MTTRRGFTLIEIMISTAIFAILTTIVFFDFASQSARSALPLAVEQLNTDFQDMLNNSQAGVIFDSISDTPKGYGLSITLDAVTPANNTSYTTFADLKVGATEVGNGQFDGAAELIQSRTLPPRVIISQISIDPTVLYDRTDFTYSLPGSRLAVSGIPRGQASMVSITQQVHIVLKNVRNSTCSQMDLQPGQPTITITKSVPCV